MTLTGDTGKRNLYLTWRLNFAIFNVNCLSGILDVRHTLNTCPPARNIKVLLNLFNLKLSQINVVVHPESIIHSMVNFADGSTTALLSSHDMRIPIFYALNWPSREYYNIKKIDLLKIKTLTFEKTNTHLMDSINLAYYVLKKGGSYPLIFNTANEVAVSYFLKEKINFLDILKIIKKILSKSENYKINTIDDIYSIDKKVRILTSEYIMNR